MAKEKPQLSFQKDNPEPTHADELFRIQQRLDPDAERLFSGRQKKFAAKAERAKYSAKARELKEKAAAGAEKVLKETKKK